MFMRHSSEARKEKYCGEREVQCLADSHKGEESEMVAAYKNASGTKEMEEKCFLFH